MRKSKLPSIGQVVSVVFAQHRPFISALAPSRPPLRVRVASQISVPASSPRLLHASTSYSIPIGLEALYFLPYFLPHYTVCVDKQPKSLLFPLSKTVVHDVTITAVVNTGTRNDARWKAIDTIQKVSRHTIGHKAFER